MQQQNRLLLGQKIRDIFCEHDSVDFTPESYQSVLDKIVTSDSFYLNNAPPSPEIAASMDAHSVENHLSDIILRLMVLNDDEEQNQNLISNLSDSYYYLLETGNYEQLIHLIKQCDSEEIPLVLRQHLRDNYTSRACLEEMLAGLNTWGKPKYDVISRLIRLVGLPFIEVLLDRLAEEESLSLRRFLMDRLQEFGSAAKAAILARLSDNRWFVLRNLIIMLRNMNDVTVLDQIRPLMDHPNNRVRLEALRSCLYFQDPAAERQILYDMSSSDHEKQLAAIQLAERSRSVDVFKKLLSILARPGLNSIECELKSAAIQSLAETGRTEAMPELIKLLSSKSLLNSRQLGKLKLDIVRSLHNYPVSFSRPILQKIAAGNGELANQAAESLKLLAENNRCNS